MRLIDADALLNILSFENELIRKIYLIDLITNAPTVQREEQDKLAGWVSVPIEPTEAMIKCMVEAGIENRREFRHLHDSAKSIYKAMIEAAPTGSNT